VCPLLWHPPDRLPLFEQKRKSTQPDHVVNTEQVARGSTGLVSRPQFAGDGRATGEDEKHADGEFRILRRLANASRSCEVRSL
jgi:hypothetical protein